jgi:hypothetical protein
MKLWRLLLMVILVGCAGHSQKIITVTLTNNHSLQISGFDKAVIDDIGRDSSSEAWQVLLPVYKMPADTDMKDFQNPQAGKYSIKDSLVIFIPDTAFKKGQVYFVRSFDYSTAKDAWAFVRQKKQKGSAGHKDLLFKY